MSDRPILFSAPMVRALLEGRKTQTRRVLNPQPPRQEDFYGSSFGMCRSVDDGVKMYSLNDYERLPKHPTRWDLVGSVGVARNAGFPKSYNARFAVDDRLWVKETHCVGYDYDEDDKPVGERHAFYAATECPRWYDTEKDEWRDQPRWTPSIFMRRRYSRLTLLVTDVRVEPLKDCSEADAIAEGIHQWTNQPVEGEPHQAFKAFGREPAHRDPRLAYRDLWNSINGAGAWEENPWVVAVSFTVEQRNIDA